MSELMLICDTDVCTDLLHKILPLNKTKTKKTKQNKKKSIKKYLLIGTRF